MSSVSNAGLEESFFHCIRALLEHDIDQLPHVGSQGGARLAPEHGELLDGVRDQLLVEECRHVSEPEQWRVWESGLGRL